jgi:hypothetical protein
MASEKIREVEVAIEAALLRQRDELLAAVNGLLGLVELVDGRDDMPIVLAENHRYKDALALVKRIEGMGSVGG